MPHGACLPNSKQLRRVAGELVLVPIKLDPIRSSTRSCVPLKRCSKSTTINFIPHSATANHAFRTSQNSISGSIHQCCTTTETYTRQSTVSTVERNHNQTCSLSSSTKTESIFHSLFSEKLIVPPNSIQTCSSRSYDPVVTRSLTNEPLVVLHRHIKKARRKINVGASTHKSSAVDDTNTKASSVLTKFRSSESRTPLEPQDTETSTANSSPTPNKYNLTTATTLELPGSQGQITKPSEWSITNHDHVTPPKFQTESSSAFTNLYRETKESQYQIKKPSEWIVTNRVATPKFPTQSSGSFTTIDREAKEGITPIPNVTPTTMGGEGDSSVKTSFDQERIPGPDCLTIVHPPTSLKSSASDKSEFRLTFRKPKPRPRSIITSKSVRSPVTATVSTPNARSASVYSNTNVDIRNNNLEGNDDNNNDIRATSGNADVKRKPCSSKCSKDSLVKCGLSGGKIQTGHEVIVMPLDVEDTGATEEEVVVGTTDPFQSMPDNTGEYDRDDSFWNSDTTQEENSIPVPTTPEHIEIKPSSATPSYNKSSTEKKKSKSSPSPYGSSPYGQSYPYGSQQFASEQPMLITEKGAIRFHLPGRIQHKTTIKVAHFPTGDEKNVILNVKPDNDECEETPCCANNQNFVVPPFPSCPTPSPYGSYPYGYGGYPYNYYAGYGGYPPYC